jgi:hypothetical protein
MGICAARPRYDFSHSWSFENSCIFGQKNLRVLCIEFLHQFPKWRKDTEIHAEVVERLAVATDKAHVEVWTPDKPDEPLEKRIDRVIKNLEGIREVQRRHAEQIDKFQEDHEKYRREQDQAHVKMENEIQANLESLHTSDILVSLVGLIWLTFGITMSTLSQELSKLLQ